MFHFSHLENHIIHVKGCTLKMDEAQAYLGRGLQELKGVSESFKISGIPQMFKKTTTPRTQEQYSWIYANQGSLWAPTRNASDLHFLHLNQRLKEK